MPSIPLSLMLLVSLILFLTGGVYAQESPATAESLRLAEQLRAAVDARDWKKAADLSAALKIAVTEARNHSFARGTTEQVNAILRWLPENTESVLVAQEPFTIQAPHPHMEHDALTGARGYSLGLLGAADEGVLFQALQGRTLRFAVFAARMFANHPPGPYGNLPLGLIAYQGCAVYAFAQPLSDVGFFQQYSTLIAGKPVTLARGMQRDRLSDADQEDTYLLTLLQPDTILACNDQDFFETLVVRITKPSSQLAFPPNFPAWRELDRSAAIWAIRRFLPQRAGLDPSHPHTPRGGFTGMEDKSATSLVMQISPGNVKGRWVSKSETDPWQRLAEVPDFRGKATSHRRPDGVWELDVRDDGSSGRFAVFVLMGTLGLLALI